jgi:hypothetical protein
MSAIEPQDASYSAPARIAERLAATRQRLFVGRHAERAIFSQALQASQPPFAVLYLHGPGGIGKSTLLREYRTAASSLGRRAVLLDARTVDPHPGAFLAQLAAALGQPERLLALEELATSDLDVLLIDTYEDLAPLDAWLRETFLPHLPAHALVVLAGRVPPAPAWQTDIAWRALMHSRAIQNFDVGECAAFLQASSIAARHLDAAVSATYGHPLALALYADLVARCDSAELTSFSSAPQAVQTLLEHFVRQVPSPLHRQALELCGHVRVTTQGLLSDMFGADESPALFEWLRGLSFVEQMPHGLVPHDLARDMLDSELRWRDPQAYRRLHGRAREVILRALRAATGRDQRGAFADLLYLHRGNPVMRPFYEWRSLGVAYSDALRPHEAELVIDLVERYEGGTAAAIAHGWLERRPQDFHVFRGGDNLPIGFLCALSLGASEVAASTHDPALAGIRRFIERHGPLRPGEEVLLQRFWTGCDSYQEPGPVHNLVAMVLGTAWLTNPRLAWAFTMTARVEEWQPLFSYLNFMRAPEADWTDGGRTYGVFAHDWRAEPAVQWLDLMAQRELDTTRVAYSVAETASLQVLSEQAFAEAVRQALRDFARPAMLQHSALLHTHMLEQRGDPTPQALQSLLAEAIESLHGDPRDHKLYRALVHTYVTPAPTQEQAAEQLNLPFSTYRFHLARGIARVTAWLWQRELHPGRHG